VAHHLAVDRAPADFDFDRDVDDNDLAHLAECLTGPQLPWTDPCCEATDLDGDGDVDQDDFGKLQRCYAGPDTVPESDCAE
jgi:hypothetical protein